MSLRNEWKFPKTAAVVLGQAALRHDHHKAREAHYQAEVDAALADIRERGIIVEEEDDARLSLSHTSRSYRLSGPRIDPELSERLEKANEKLSRHRSRRMEYDRWSRALLGLPGEQVVELNAEDLEFFGF